MTEEKPPAGGKTVQLRTIADFVALPPEKIGACLIDFCYWLETIAAFSGVPGIEPAVSLDVFEWVDDGKHVMSLVLHDGQTGAVLHESAEEFAEPETTEETR